MGETIRRDANVTVTAPADPFDHGSDPSFLAYYAQESLSSATVARFSAIRERSLALLQAHGRPVHSLRVADIGCGTGTQARLWAELGHQVRALDVNEPLIQIARERAHAQRLPIRFDVGTATALPYDDASFDVCLLPELLEHVPDWKACVREAARVLARGGLLYLSTTSALCPIQQEFNLPLYSWYPRFLKRHYEKLAVTTRPEIANHAKYPAVHWFTFYQLRDFLKLFGLVSFDRFDVINEAMLSAPARTVIRVTRAVPLLRFVGFVFTEGTMIFALKEGGS